MTKGSTALFLILLSGCTHKPPRFKKYQPQQNVSEKSFVIIVPSYNNRDWYRYNLDSIFMQRYNNYRLIYIDDSSTDNTEKLVEEYIKKQKNKNIKLIKNKQRIGALANIWHAIQLCENNEIIINLDGDDWFAHNQVLYQLNQIYQNNDVWLTYGQFKNWPTGKVGWCKEIPPNIIRENKFREYGFWFAQPRTYYAWLAKRIKKEDLINPQTKAFYQVAGDVALMLPMVEMAGNHIKFIPQILYYRNVKTPLNDFKCHLEEQLKITEMITHQKSYQPLLKTLQFQANNVTLRKKIKHYEANC